MLGHRYFSAINFTDPKELQSNQFVYAGVPVGYSAALSNRFSPQFAFSNFSNQVQTISIQSYSPSGTPQSAKTPQQITLQPNSSATVAVPADANASGYVSYVTTASGAPGDVFSSLMDQADTGDSRFLVIGKDPASDLNAGMHPWAADKDHKATVVAFNHTPSNQDVTLSIGIGNGSMWQRRITLQPYQTLTEDLEQLVSSGALDDKKTALPKNLSHGEVTWWTNDTKRVTGRLIQIDGSDRMVENFSCYGEIVLCSLLVSSSPTEGPVGARFSFIADTQYCTTNYGGSSVCSGPLYGSGGGANFTWSTYNAFQSTSSSNASDSALSVAPGNGTAYAEAQSGNCFASGTAPVTVKGTATPTISTISPITYGQADTLLITGNGFSQYNATSVSITVPNVSVSNVNIISNSQITASYVTDCSSLVGPQNLTIDSGNKDIPSTSGIVQISLPSAPIPSILFGGNATSDTQSVIVGQQIALTASVPELPNCTTQSGQTWSTPPGTAVGGYTASQTGASVAPLPSNNSPGYTFYWADSGTGRLIHYSYVMTGGGASVTSSAVYATFDVAGPSSVTVTKAVGEAQVLNIYNSPRLSFGDATTAPGFSVSESATLPPNAYNTFQWVQLIQSNTTTHSVAAGGMQTCTDVLIPASGTAPYLDNTYPYSFMNATKDSPYSESLDSSWSAYSHSFSARVYLMYDPGLPNSIVVPLGYVDWNFSGSASIVDSSANTWQVSGSQSSASDYVPSASYPIWNAYAPSPGTLTCH